MKVNLPIVVCLSIDEQKDYYECLNKVFKFSGNEKNVLDKDKIISEQIRSSENDAVAMFKLGTDFRSFGSNGSFSSDYIFIFNSNIKYTNEDIIKSFLENHRGQLKNINEVNDCLDNGLYKKFIKDINLEKIIEDLELEGQFFKNYKPKIKP